MAKRTDALTEIAKPIADKLADHTGSLKVVLSAGVVVLDRLSPDARERAIAIANGIDDVELEIYIHPTGQELLELWRQVEKIGKKVGVKVQKPK